MLVYPFTGLSVLAGNKNPVYGRSFEEADGWSSPGDLSDSLSMFSGIIAIDDTSPIPSLLVSCARSSRARREQVQALTCAAAVSNGEGGGSSFVLGGSSGNLLK